MSRSIYQRVLIAFTIVAAIAIGVCWRESHYHSISTCARAATTTVLLFAAALVPALIGIALRRRPLRLLLLALSLCGAASLVVICFSGITDQASQYAAQLYGSFYLPSMYVLFGAFMLIHLELTLRLAGRRV